MITPPNPIDIPAVVVSTAHSPSENPMLDVHPPHEPVHGIRDFLLHILTITIGLLIALGLEGAVEYMHHRHIVAEARENIRHEMETNHDQLAKNLKSIHEDAVRLNDDMETIRAMRAEAKGSKEHRHLEYSLNWSSFNDSAWRSARDMGALTYMPYQEVQDYADVYGQQEIVNDAAVKLFSSQSLVVAPMAMQKDPYALPPDEALTMLRDTARTALSVEILRQTMQELETAYADALKKK